MKRAIIKHWHAAIGDPMLADAILDRLVHSAYRIDLNGESLRKTKGLQPHPSERPLLTENSCIIEQHVVHFSRSKWCTFQRSPTGDPFALESVIAPRLEWVIEINWDGRSLSIGMGDRNRWNAHSGPSLSPLILSKSNGNRFG